MRESEREEQSRSSSIVRVDKSGISKERGVSMSDELIERLLLFLLVRREVGFVLVGRGGGGHGRGGQMRTEKRRNRRAENGKRSRIISSEESKTTRSKTSEDRGSMNGGDRGKRKDRVDRGRRGRMARREEGATKLVDSSGGERNAEKFLMNKKIKTINKI